MVTVLCGCVPEYNNGVSANGTRQFAHICIPVPELDVHEGFQVEAALTVCDGIG
jgi:hypothetical protein